MVMAVSSQLSGRGLGAARGMSRPHSLMRSRRKRAVQEEDTPVHRAPTPARAPDVSTVRRFISTIFIDSGSLRLVPVDDRPDPPAEPLGLTARREGRWT